VNGRGAIHAGLLALLIALPAAARENLATERAFADAMMVDAFDARALAERETLGPLAGTTGPLDPVAEDEPGRSWALLPQIGFSPERGLNAGIKFADRDLYGLAIDLGGIYATKGQQEYGLSLLAPDLLDGLVQFLLEAEFEFDPTKEFFGLGNNEVGPDPISTHESQVVNVLGTIAVRPFPWLTLSLGAGFSETKIRRGKLEKGRPSTVDRFDELTGIRGGRTNPIAFSIVYNNREDPTRPTRGWNLVAKIQHVGETTGSDFKFTRYIFDGSYLYPLLTRRQIVGLRIGGEFIDSDRREIPFFELASLGGSSDLRGYFHDRFLGRSRVMINLEYRVKLLDFRMPKLWLVRIDGVAFGDMGRVFLDDSELSDEFRVDRDLLPRVFEDFRYSYGGGVRIALGQAILARIDVGFSDEETALLYLTFGHTF
jgi:outer membrane protein assembly factor BamA